MRELSNIEKKNNEVQIPIGPINLNGNLDILKELGELSFLHMEVGVDILARVTSTLHKNFKKTI